MRPVINVNWNGAQSYVDWLTKKSGHHYRLPSEAEREYVTRVGSEGPYWWGAGIDRSRANIDAPVRATSSGSTDAPRRQTVRVDAFDPNSWGFFNVHGNVWEWTANCWNDDNLAQPADGRALQA